MSSITTTTTADTRNRSRVKDAVGLAARLVLGGALIYAALSKITMLEESARATRAYELFPREIADMIGYALPFVELVLGAVVLLGLFTRLSALAGTILMVVFVAGIVSAWARGLTIECGCFGGGGQIGADEARAGYIRDIVRDTIFALCGVWLVVRPRSLAALDRFVLPDHYADRGVQTRPEETTR